MKIHTRKSAIRLADWIIEKLDLTAPSYELECYYRDRLILYIQNDGALDWFNYYRANAE